MTEISGIERIMSAEGAEQLALQIRNAPSPTEFVRTLERAYETSNLYHEIEHIASLMAFSPDNANGIGKAKHKAIGAFVDGALLGMRVAEEFLPKDAFEAMMDGVYVGAGINTKVQPIGGNNPGEDFANLAFNGYVLASRFHRVISEHEEAICPDFPLQPMLKFGFGFAIDQITAAQGRADAVTSAEMPGGPLGTHRDWDQGLINITGPPKN